MKDGTIKIETKTSTVRHAILTEDFTFPCYGGTYTYEAGTRLLVKKGDWQSAGDGENLVKPHGIGYGIDLKIPLKVLRFEDVISETTTRTHTVAVQNPF